MTPHVTIHMVASLDGFVARSDGGVDWLETSDDFAGGDTLEPGFIEEFLQSIDCYVMGSRTYETALGFKARELGWAYGNKPTFVLTRRELPRAGNNVETRYSIVPILIGDGIPFFQKLEKDIPLHLADVKAYRSGMVELRYRVRR